MIRGAIVFALAATSFFAFQYTTFALAVRYPSVFDSDIRCGVVAYDNGGLRECGVFHPLGPVPLVTYAAAHGPDATYPVCYDCIDPATQSYADAHADWNR